MTNSEQREAARKFYNNWKEKTDEKQHGQSFWRALLSDVFGVDDVDQYIEFERRVVVDGQQKYIDAYIPETKVMIEQKSGGKDLSKAEPQSGGIMLTPYEQAKRYANNMPLNQMPQYIVACNFHEFWVYDQNKPGEDPEVIKLDNLQNEYQRLEFLIQKKHISISQEMQLSIKAGELVGKIHDRFLEQYNDPLAKHTQRSLNILCVRLVFCLYAEDAGLFGQKDAFERYIAQYEPKDIRRALIDLFQVLDTPLDERADMYLADDLAAFPYVNGGLFADENIVIPKITDGIKQTLVEASRFEWSNISPTIFGAVFESTLNPETRRAGGMHYTSVENIHKVIDPLFLDDLRKELGEISEIKVPSVQKKRLNAFQDKLAGLKFLDPACGSGNFLTETYLSLRRLENEVLRLRIAADRKEVTGQIVFGFEESTPVKVSIGQFYGIEINDFACTVAKTALWIAESQMLQETEGIVHTQIDFLPLRSYANIVEGNALRIDWNKVINRNELNYIMGNPPFVGKKEQTKEQKNELFDVFQTSAKGTGNLDYVACWYIKACRYMSGHTTRAAFVSTNSITQGEQVSALWHHLRPLQAKIIFAHRTFRWDSEASDMAHVHCVIIGFTVGAYNGPLYIYEENGRTEADNINPYLLDAPTVIIDSRSRTLSEMVPKIMYGSMPIDDGHLTVSDDEAEKIISECADCQQYIREYIGGNELINGKYKKCLWLYHANPAIFKQSKTIMGKIEDTRLFREGSGRPQTIAAAQTPYLFGEIRQPDTAMLVIPKVSSEKRRYIPIGFVGPEVIVSGSALIVPGATLYEMGIISSNVHNSWMRAVCGRLETRYQYSSKIVYNNFPWPTPTPDQKQLIEQTAQGILDARALYPDASLADLYDPLTMPPELRKAHQRNDAAVMRAYGFSVKDMSEADCVAALMKMYQELVSSKGN